MCDEADESYDFTREQWRRARKEHRCGACRETIRRGDRYHYFSGKFDGLIESHCHCARCWRMVSALQKRDPYAAIDLELNCGEVWDNPPPEIAALAFVSRDEAQALPVLDGEQEK